MAKCPRRQGQQGRSLYCGRVWNIGRTERRAAQRELTGCSEVRLERKDRVRPCSATKELGLHSEGNSATSSPSRLKPWGLGDRSTCKSSPQLLWVDGEAGRAGRTPSHLRRAGNALLGLEQQRQKAGREGISSGPTGLPVGLGGKQMGRKRK